MLILMIFLFGIAIVDSNHFNGGTIRWAPVNPSDNATNITIKIIQTYFWSYPLIKCDINVPISTPGRTSLSRNLTCVVDCSADGGYSTKPISILTDCVSSAFAPNIMVAERTTNITLTSGAHFYLAYVGSAWTSLGSPAQSGLEWSIVTMIDLRRRSDGLINTPPTASVVSPQYAIVNRTTQIRIQVSDSDIGDDVRCRWSIYTSGSRRRRNLYVETDDIDPSESVHIRNKRMHLCSQCSSTCKYRCQCNCSVCSGTNCTGTTCSLSAGCSGLVTTTLDTPGTLRSTSTYPTRQAINECGDICFPSSIPNSTTLSNCTLSFRGLVPDTWYAVAIQVEDFINKSSTAPMSSVPVQLLIYVMPEPLCTQAPVILPVVGCQEASIGIPKIFNITVLNMCNSDDTDVSDLVVSRRITGMLSTDLSNSSSNISLSSMTFTWTPQSNQIGSQQMCLIAYTGERVQSDEYCLTFTVISSGFPCATTTTSTTSTTSTTTTTITTTKTTTTTTTPISSNSMLTVTTTAVTTTGASFNFLTTSSTSEKSPSWGLIAGICTAVLPLIFVSVCCSYQLLWSPKAKRRLMQEERDFRNGFSFSHSEKSDQTIAETCQPSAIERPNKSYRVYKINSSETLSRSIQADTDSTEESRHIYPGKPDDANPISHFSMDGSSNFMDSGENSVLSRLFTNQETARIPSPSFTGMTKSDFLPDKQAGNVDRANSGSVLMSTFLAQKH